MNIIEEEMDKQRRDDAMEEEYQRARKRAMWLLGARDYSNAALREKLLNNYAEETADRVIADMVHYGFLDDEKYAKKLAAYLVKTKKYGLYRAKVQMRQKGVPADLIDSALKSYEKDDYVNQLVILIKKKYSSKISDPDDRRKTVSALVRRGYGFGEVKEAINTVLSEIEEEPEKFQKR